MFDGDGDSTHHVNQNVHLLTFPLLDQLGGIVLLPLLQVVLAEVPLEGLLAPGAVDGVGDRSERRDRLVFAGVFQELRKKKNLL